MFHRERLSKAFRGRRVPGSAPPWAAGASVTRGMESSETMRTPMPNSDAPTVNPFLGSYETADGGAINLCIVSPPPTPSTRSSTSELASHAQHSSTASVVIVVAMRPNVLRTIISV